MKYYYCQQVKRWLFMAKATAGQKYQFLAGDTLLALAKQAYGNSGLFTRIADANQSVLKGAGPAVGDILYIPLLSEIQQLKTELAKERLSNKKPNELTIIIGGRELLVQTARITKRLDAGTDGWFATIKWTRGADPELDRLLIPYGYPLAQLYIGNELIINGVLYIVEHTLTDNASGRRLQGFSFTADIVDSHFSPPYEVYQSTLKDRADQLIRPFGINVIFNDDNRIDEAFQRITASANIRIFDHLADLASQRGLLLTSTNKGDALFTRSNSGQSVGTVAEGSAPALSWTATFNGRNRYNIYKAIGQSPFGAKDAIAIDNIVPRPRFHLFSANDTTEGNIQDAVNWKRSKQLAEAMATTIPVGSWFAPNGKLWEKNTLVTIVSETLGVPLGHTFLIRRIEFEYDILGQTAKLDVVPPQVYTGENIDEPWAA